MDLWTIISLVTKENNNGKILETRLPDKINGSSEEQVKGTGFKWKLGDIENKTETRRTDDKPPIDLWNQ